MRILCFGLNHETASVAHREKITFSEHAIPEALESLNALEGIEGSVILSTCNRMEIYSATSPNQPIHETVERLKTWLVERFSLANDDCDAFYHHAHRDSAQHLFCVASGLNSMVIGETEIFGQVKKAYAIAHRVGATEKTLNRLFQRSFLVGKQVRTHTHITRGATSVGAVGVELAEKIFGDLKSCQILLIGAGEISRKTAQSLQSRGAQTVIVSNRSFDRAQELAESINGKAIHFDEWDSELAKVDIIISSTAAPHHVVTPEKLHLPLRHRRGRPLFMIDLSVPRDIAPEVKDLEGVYVYDLDALQRLAANAKAKREEQFDLCHEIIKTHVTELLEQTSRSHPATNPNSASSGESGQATTS